MSFAPIEDRWFNKLDKPSDFDLIHVEVAFWCPLSGTTVPTPERHTESLVSGTLYTWPGASVVYVQLGENATVPVLRGQMHHWEFEPGVHDIRAVWSEADYEEISVDDLEPGDWIVRGSLLSCVTDVSDEELTVDRDAIPDYDHENIKYALRKRKKLPTAPGVYKDQKGNTWLHLKDGAWMMLDSDYRLYETKPAYDTEMHTGSVYQIGG